MNEWISVINETEETLLKGIMSNGYNSNELNQEAIYNIVDEIAEIHGAASYLISIDKAYSESEPNDKYTEPSENNKIIYEFDKQSLELGKKLLILEFYEKDLVRIRNYFRYERIRFEENFHVKSENNSYEQKLEII